MRVVDRPAAGTEFKHLRVLDPDFQPGPGQRHADAPKAVMVVTTVRGATVHYAYRDGGGRFAMSLDTWQRDYGRGPS